MSRDGRCSASADAGARRVVELAAVESEGLQELGTGAAGAVCRARDGHVIILSSSSKQQQQQAAEWRRWWRFKHTHTRTHTRTHTAAAAAVAHSVDSDASPAPTPAIKTVKWFTKYAKYA